MNVGLPEWYDPGVPRTMKNIRLGLKDHPNSAAKGAALRDAAEILNLIVNQTLADCSECGAFLGELLPYLWKKRSQLSVANYYFETTYSKWESSRPGTRKGSSLRRFIHDLISEAKRQRIWLAYPGGPISEWITLDTQILSVLPEFGPAPDVVEKWVDILVYPHLVRNVAQLRDHPEIGKMKKALDENGKFQISRLKPLVSATVARVAALPQPHYFDSEAFPLRVKSKWSM